MLASTASQNIAAKPAALPPAAQPNLPASGSAGGPSFAQFLNDQPPLTPPPAHADPVPRDPESAPSESTPTPAAAPARRPASPAPAKPAQNRTPDASASAKPDQAAVSGEEADDSSLAKTDAAQDPETAGLDEFTQLIGLTPQALPAQAVPAATPLVAAASAEAAEGEAPGAKHAGRGRVGRLADDDEGAVATTRTASGTDTASSAAVERRPAEAPARDAAPRAKGIELAAAADKAAARSASNSETLQAAATAGGASTPHAAGATEALPSSFAAVLAQAMPAAAAVSDAAAVNGSGQVRAAVQSSAFAPELGARVTLMAVDGVQQAELQLNPADMGPVSVQIVVDGSQAQVSFHAAQAETRQALEQGLPDLAAALQGQGLTLSGGGVFQQAPRDAQGGDAEAGRNDDNRGSRSGSGGGRVGASATAAATPARRSVGLLDTFA